MASNFRHQITYIVEERNVMKDTVYFVATPTTFDLISQEGEINECVWCSYEEVLEKLDFDNIKEIFNKAYDYIKNNI